ncbi:DUF4383 domain-containing protein [Amycolatopsis azurea]|uniref:DUF4383 domain-containing protein n=1 Tax=Amycolatopsis azurea DSM 43854 TaxID=1238180 RepID=M2Q9S9_9PSEU|nr:DUF4383 domain-containing protein [Amycolatopsis azurea]EMD23421.1 hypothetical protein C791_7247 [Amycolatopsis azurea DSM 43854]OOC04900.1 hypothetical protein B0293_20845 [Amycolatopsis azurea DSM 43854]
MNENTIGRSLRPVVLLIALVHLVLGVLGFFFLPEANQTGENTVWIFSATGMLNIIRTIVGVLGVAAVLKPSAIYGYTWMIFIAFAGLTAFGVLSAATTSAGDTVNVNWADNVLHALTSLAALAVGIVVARSAGRKPARRRADA